jgi:hypothetical protein
MRTIAALLGLLAFAGLYPLYAQDRVWEHTSIKDPLTGAVVERFILTGEYLAPPYPAPPPPTSDLAVFAAAIMASSSALNDAPKLVLDCSEGRYIKQYGLVRGLPMTPTGLSAKIDAVIDGGVKKTVVTKVANNSERGVGDDRISYSAFELDNILPDILHGTTITLVARMDTNGPVLIGSPMRQILTEFRIPSPAPVIAACGDFSSQVNALPTVTPSATQDPVWEHTVVKDFLTGHAVDRFVLKGEYLVSATPTLSLPPGISPGSTTLIVGGVPTYAASSDIPRLVLTCSDGRLVKHVAIVRRLPSSPQGIPGKIDTVIDGGRKKTVASTISINTERGITDDRGAYSAIELGNILFDLLRGKTVTLVARMDLSGSIGYSGSQPQVLTEFRIPSPAPILAACGNDKFIRGLQP